MPTPPPTVIARRALCSAVRDLHPSARPYEYVLSFARTLAVESLHAKPGVAHAARSKRRATRADAPSMGPASSVLITFPGVSGGLRAHLTTSRPVASGAYARIWTCELIADVAAGRQSRHRKCLRGPAKRSVMGSRGETWWMTTGALVRAAATDWLAWRDKPAGRYLRERSRAGSSLRGNYRQRRRSRS